MDLHYPAATMMDPSFVQTLIVRIMTLSDRVYILKYL